MFRGCMGNSDAEPLQEETYDCDQTNDRLHPVCRLGAGAGPPGLVTILHDEDHPSSLLLPLLAQLPPLPTEPVPLDQQAGIQEVR